MHAAVGRTVTAAWGQAFLTPALDRCYDRNLLWVVDDGDGLSAAALDRHADRLLGGHGMTHRRLVVEPAADARLRDDLVTRGYDAGDHLFMAHAGRVPQPVAGIAVEEVGIDPVLAATEHYLKTDPATQYGRDPRTRAHLLAHHREYGPTSGAERRFAVCDAGEEVVAWARLWRRGDEAQVEDVVCLAEHRGRGYGRAVVAAATRAALDEGADLVFIVADDRDWPKDLYGRLGYAPIGTLGVYLRFDPRAAS
ncbi:MAG TPA: GNAT family N-acetyltransferase [Baekduia sp.]|nr:GNAT family N-acetyltransferase [Baekduia sp.]